jgi:ribosomal protein L37AE/L43A
VIFGLKFKLIEEYKMTRLLCPECEVELVVYKTGVDVIETRLTSNDVQQPMRLWRADVWECPGCGMRIIAGFSTTPESDFEPEFKSSVTKAKRAHNYYYDNERNKKHIRAEH